ncbi:MAG TPA: PQQ-binding-like beta-propeller repeat protein [Kouleothrix sp.]|uniref:outer membrane protein assembly factor BamB family protein n=1 Tax=Kouleothrix sp. TaxID=2779161 RepID=UPI002B89D501|nr:PQQ-binding-like beta-propeller repeat protein [Kouleothrix sp.]HRC74340.1 PQQ-binding-like beta-propeller repeat protein [Kouleothrix sp.]
MSNSAEPIVFSCPRCGAAIAMQGNQGTCAYCGTPVERPNSINSVGGSVNSWSLNINTGYPRAGTPRPRVRFPLMLALFLAGLIGFGGFLAGRASTVATNAPALLKQLPSLPANLPADIATVVSVASNERAWVNELVAVLPRDGQGGDLLAYMYHSDSSRYTLALIDGSSHAARWQSPLLSKDAYQGAVALGDDQVFFTDNDQLVALRRRDGSVAWQAALAVEPRNSCDGCLRLVGKQVAVLEKDGTVQVFSAQSGQPAWTQRLANQPNQLNVAGSRIVTITESDDHKRTAIDFLDPASGKSTLQLAPTCPRAHDTFDDERPDASSSMLFNADGSSMYLIFGFFARCAQSWDLNGGTLRWQTPLKDNQFGANWLYDQPLQTDGAIYTSDGSAIWALDTASGQARVLAADKDYTLTPLMARDDVLIARAAPTWDSQRQEIWGIDTKSGERRWQQKLKAHDMRHGSSSGDWEARLTPNGLLVAQVLRDDAQLQIDMFDPRTGKSLGQQQHALADMHMPSLRASLWGDDTAWLMIDSTVFAIDMKSGQIAYRMS